jgi:outer membrane receptor for monomeric catechols
MNMPIEDLQPRSRGTLFNRYTFGRGALQGLSLSLGSVYTGTRDLTNANARNEPNWCPLPAWWRFDAIAGYRVKVASRPVNLSLKVSKLLDDRDIYYVASWFRYTIDAGREWQSG